MPLASAQSLQVYVLVNSSGVLTSFHNSYVFEPHENSPAFDSLQWNNIRWGLGESHAFTLLILYSPLGVVLTKPRNVVSMWINLEGSGKISTVTLH